MVKYTDLKLGDVVDIPDYGFQKITKLHYKDDCSCIDFTLKGGTMTYYYKSQGIREGLKLKKK